MAARCTHSHQRSVRRWNPANTQESEDHSSASERPLPLTSMQITSWVPRHASPNSSIVLPDFSCIVDVDTDLFFLLIYMFTYHLFPLKKYNHLCYNRGLSLTLLLTPCIRAVFDCNKMPCAPLHRVFDSSLGLYPLDTK